MGNSQAAEGSSLTWDYPPMRGGIQLWMFRTAKRPDTTVLVLA
jgi:hypothetical protein